eukprot:m.14742 g.14742  ORF g.14742 m.14742 type:complete len:772 (+) comp25958_c0_seq1:2639-4954(+)
MTKVSNIVTLLSLAVSMAIINGRQLRSDGGDGQLVDRWLCKIRGGRADARRMAERLDLVLLGKVGSTGRVYEFSLPEGSRRRRRDVENVDEVLDQELTVVWFKQERSLIRKGRNRNTPQDQNPLYRSAWPRSTTSSAQSTSSRLESVYMNVVPVWRMNITGKGSVVSILDDGLERTHPDIKGNYDQLASYDFNNRDSDPMPRYDGHKTNRHGTRCAGVVAAVPGKSVCGAPGVSFNARVGGIRMLDGLLTDAVEANALSYRQQHIDIYTVSWGPSDNGRTLEGPSREARRALANGAKKGRKGKGSVFVWAAGNGGQKQDSCACDGYINSIYTLGISAVDFMGKAPSYTESCTSIMAVAFSSGTETEKTITTTDLNQTCTAAHTGTSAAAPLAAGVIALALEANPDLTWRDVQYITALTSKKTDPTNPSWKQNGANFSVSSRYGFGLLDAYAFVRTAQQWKQVPKQLVCPVVSTLPSRHFFRDRPLKIKVSTDVCQGSNNIGIKHLEHVEVSMSISHPSRGDIQITLISPMGTKSVLLPYRPRDKSGAGFIRWTFMSVHHWGENPAGEWTLEVRDKGGPASHCVPGAGKCQLNSILFFKFYGVNDQPYQENVIFREGKEVTTEKPTMRSEIETEIPNTEAETISAETTSAVTQALHGTPSQASPSSPSTESPTSVQLTTQPEAIQVSSQVPDLTAGKMVTPTVTIAADNDKKDESFQWDTREISFWNWLKVEDKPVNTNPNKANKANKQTVKDKASHNPHLKEKGKEHQFAF